MPLDIAINTNAILENGSGKWWVADVNASSGTVATSPGFSTGPLIKDSTIKKGASAKSKEDEGGTTYPAGNTYVGEFSGTFMQRDQKTYDFIRYCNSNTITVIKELSSAAVDGKYQYAYIPFCKGDGNEEFKFPGGEVPFKFDLTPTSANVSIDLSTFTFTGSGVTLTGNITCDSGEYYEIFSVAT